MSKLSRPIRICSALAAKVGKATAITVEGFTAERDVVAAIAACQKPDQAALSQLVGPVGEKMEAAQSLTEGRRTEAFNHYKAVAEGLQVGGEGSTACIVVLNPRCGITTGCGAGWEDDSRQRLQVIHHTGAELGGVQRAGAGH